MTTSPEREAIRIARARPWTPARKLAKAAGVPVATARRVLDEVAARAAAEAGREGEA